MINVIFIRHSQTRGNLLHRYIGRTNEKLCEEGIKLLESKSYPQVDFVYVSPMIRCIETANFIYKNCNMAVIDGLKECDFGDFENKNYEELKDNNNYQKWIDSNGMIPFPKGEDVKKFKERCVNAFDESIADAIANNYKTIAFVVHGGTIMSILDKYSFPHKDYYDWQIKNGEIVKSSIYINEWCESIKKVLVSV